MAYYAILCFYSLLSNNKLSVIPGKGTLTGKAFSYNLDLSNNRIVDIPAGIFNGTTVGRYL